MSSDDSRYLDTGGPYWGAEFEELCRGHRAYVKRPAPGANAHGVRVDLHEDPDGNYVGEPVPSTECFLCNKHANEHGHGLHGVSVYDCPNCGAETEPRTWKGRGSNLNLRRCYDCRPRFPLLGKPVRLAAGLLRRVLP